MVRVIEDYAAAFLSLAAKNNCVERAYNQAGQWLARNAGASGPVEDGAVPPGVLADFLKYLKEKDRLSLAEAVLRRFSELALEYIGVLSIEVVSAAPLTQEQLDALQRRLIRRSGKRVRISHRVDSSLIAGLRLIAAGVVMDVSVKRQLADMREKLYKGGVFYPWTQ